MLDLSDDMLLNLIFNRALFEKICLTKIIFYAGSFKLFQRFFICGLHIHRSNISETIFKNCTLSKGSSDGS